MFRETRPRTEATVREQPEARPATPAPERTPEAAALNALLGRGSEFDGKLNFEGSVRIDGRFTGSIATDDELVIGEGAEVNAEIACGTVVVQGTLVGNIRATNTVELRSPAHVRGEIETPSLIIERGVVFEGQTHMENAGGAAKVISLPLAAAEPAD